MPRVLVTVATDFLKGVWISRRGWVVSILAGLILLIDFVAGASCGARRSVARAEAAQTVSASADASAKTAAAQARASDRRVQDQTAVVAADSGRVDAARRRLAAVRAAPPPPLPLPGLPEVPDLRPTVAAQDALVAAQDQKIKGLELQVSLLTADRDQWREAYRQEARALEAQQTVSRAYQQAMGQASRRSGVKGFLYGAGTGALVALIAKR